MNKEYSDEIVADAVRDFWNKTYPQEVIAFFYQKYDWDNTKNAWEWCEELVERNASDDYENVIFLNDFCEGQNCVKNLTIVPLDKVTGFYSTVMKLQTERRTE